MAVEDFGTEIPPRDDVLRARREKAALVKKIRAEEQAVYGPRRAKIELSDDHPAAQAIRRFEQTIATWRKYHAAVAVFTPIARQRIRQALGDGRLTATALLPNGTLHRIPAERWRTRAGDAAMTSGRMRMILTGRDEYETPDPSDVLLSADHFETWRRPNKQRPHTIGNETRLVARLTELMLAAPDTPRSRKKIKEELALEKIPWSDRGFSRAWAKALQASGAIAWGMAGRRNSAQCGKSPQRKKS